MNTLFEILSPVNNKYYTWYKAICQRATNRTLPKNTYTEIHHILPRSLYPEYSKNPKNLVTLTAREHFICHWLLTKIINDSKIIYAFQMMIPNHTGKRYLPKSSIVYHNLKLKFSINNQGTKNYSWYTDGESNIIISHNATVPAGFFPGRTFSQEHKESLKGIPKTEAQKQKQSKSMQGKPGCVGLSNSSTRPEVRDKIRKSRIGSKASKETKIKMKLSKLGKKRGPYKKSSPQTIPDAD